MISRHIHRNTGVGCGIRLLKQQLAIRLGYQRTITKSLVIAVLALLEKLLANPLSRKCAASVWLCQRRLSLAALVLHRLCLEMSILRHRCVK
jgi:hypothetical protein